MCEVACEPWLALQHALGKQNKNTTEPENKNHDNKSTARRRQQELANGRENIDRDQTEWPLRNRGGDDRVIP